jgi:hypothetical protein
MLLFQKTYNIILLVDDHPDADSIEDKRGGGRITDPTPSMET